MSFERIVQFTPAYDKRNSNPSKNYGIHGVELRMVLKGEKGATQFVLYTGWHLPHVHQELVNKCSRSRFCSIEPLPVDLGYHSPKPIYEGQLISRESCEYLDGKPCYYDGSGLNAERIYKVLLEEGHEGVWRELEDFYNELFSE